MEFRHEWKHEIGYADLLVLRTRLGAVMERDRHAVGGSYEIRSLYFDNLADKALREKIDGVNCREKFRIRYYNGDLSQIFLEKKEQDQRAVPKGAGPAHPGGGPGDCLWGPVPAGGEPKAAGVGAGL